MRYRYLRYRFEILIFEISILACAQPEIREGQSAREVLKRDLNHPCSRCVECIIVPLRDQGSLKQPVGGLLAGQARKPACSNGFGH